MPESSAARPQRVQLLVTCLVDTFYPEVGLATAGILERLGIGVTYHPEQTCCGQPAYNGGFTDVARNMARHTLDLLAADPAPVVTPSGSCADMLVHGYAELFKDDPIYQEMAERVSRRTYELTQFLVDVLGITSLDAAATGCVTYHACCHGLRGLGVDRQPRRLIDQVDGISQASLAEAEACCGFGGLFAVKMGDISGAILRRKLDDIESSGADTVVGTDVSCLMHIAGGLRRRGSRVRVKHIATLLDKGSS